MRRMIGLAGLIALALCGPPAAACGPDTDCLLTVEGRERAYRIHLPDGAAPARGAAILYAHGYRGSAAGAMRNVALTGLADALGVALVAAGSDGDDWRIPGVPSHTRDGHTPDGSAELAYFDALQADLAERFGIVPERTLMTGFSAGGMMTWTLACQRGESFAGFAPIAGTFWRPVPVSCPSLPASLVHVHGTEDRIVPLTGRPIGETHQGDVYRAIALYARHGAYYEPAQERRGDLDCETRRNAEREVLDFCLFDGGHSFRIGDLRMAWERIMERRGDQGTVPEER